MPDDVLGRAYIEIIPDVDRFRQRLASELDKISSTVRKGLTPALKNMGDEGSAAFKKVGDESSKAFKKAGDESEAATNRIGASTERSTGFVGKLSSTFGRLSKSLGIANKQGDGFGNVMNRLSKLSFISNTRVQRLISTALLLGPALIPVLATIIAQLGGLAVAAVAAGAALGVFGAVTAANFTRMKDLLDDMKKAQEKLIDAKENLALAKTDAQRASALKQVAKATKDVAGFQQQLNGPLGQAATAYKNLNQAWQKFIKANEGESFGILTRGFNLLAIIIPKLQPLFDVAAVAVDKLLARIEQGVKGGGFDRLVAFLTTHAGPALSDFSEIIINLGKIFANLGKGFGRFSGSATGSLVKLTAALVKITDTTDPNSGLSRFIAYVEKHGPVVNNVLVALAKAFVAIFNALRPLAPISLAIATALANIIAAIPQNVLTGIIAALFALGLASNVAAAGMFLLRSAATVISVLGLAFKGLLGFVKLAVAAWRLLNLAFIASPIGFIITLIIGLIAVLVIAYMRSETFRKIVDNAFKGVLRAAQAAWNWIKNNWRLLLTIITGPIGAAVLVVLRHWNTIRSAAQTAFRLVKEAVLFQVRAIIATFNFLWNLPTTIGRIFNSVRQAALNHLNALVGFVRGLPEKIRSAFGNASSLLYNTGKDIVMGLINGIKDFAQSAINAAVDMVSSAISAAKDKLKPGSPSKVFMELGTTIPQGLSRGIDKFSGVVDKAMDKMVPSSINSANGTAAGNTSATPTVQRTTPENLFVRVFVGDRELKDIVRVEISERERAIRRLAQAGTAPA